MFAAPMLIALSCTTTLTEATGGICDKVGDLPNGCSCSAAKGKGFALKCGVTVPVIDRTVQVVSDFDLCAPTATADLKVQDVQDHVTQELGAVAAGNDKLIAVPGFNIGIAGLYLEVKMDGQPLANKPLTIKIGFNACADVPLVGHACANDVPGLGNAFPVNIIDATVSGDGVLGFCLAPGTTYFWALVGSSAGLLLCIGCCCTCCYCCCCKKNNNGNAKGDYILTNPAGNAETVVVTTTMSDPLLAAPPGQKQ